MTAPRATTSASASALAALLGSAADGAPPPEIAGWEDVFRQAVYHGVAAYAYPCVRRLAAAGAGPAADPAGGKVMRAWRANALASAQRSALVDAQRAEVLGALAAAEVPCIPVKGAWLAARVYGPDAARGMTDLDLLVRQGDVSRAVAALASRGYAACRATDASNPYLNDTVLAHPSRPCPVDVHWSYDTVPGASMPPPPMERLWEGARPESLDGAKCLALAPEDHAVLLAHHLLHHDFARTLRAHLDMALLLRRLARDGFDAARLSGTAAAWGLGRAFALASAVAADLFGAPEYLAASGLVPPEDWAPEERRAAVGLALGMCDASAPKAARSLYEFKGRGFFGRIRYVLGRIAVPADMIRARYPWADTPAKVLWARAVRVRDLVREHGADVASIVSARGDCILDATGRRARLLEWALGGGASETVGANSGAGGAGATASANAGGGASEAAGADGGKGGPGGR